jgi:hypothetical protein
VRLVGLTIGLGAREAMAAPRCNINIHEGVYKY